jgi:hypothetical protein
MKSSGRKASASPRDPLRSGRQTKSEVICLTPTRFHLLKKLRRVAAPFLFARELPSLFPVSPFCRFDVSTKTSENAKSSQAGRFQAKKSLFFA